MWTQRNGVTTLAMANVGRSHQESFIGASPLWLRRIHLVGA